MAYTPMMEQYFEIKKQYEGFLLFYRLGDFYEMFFEDAQVASRELDLTLTGRDCGEGNHYGYAYFTLRCGNKRVVASGCGIIADNEFTAPSGFNYRWYSSTNPSATLTNEQVFLRRHQRHGASPHAPETDA